jgi:hypothetical protein
MEKGIVYIAPILAPYLFCEKQRTSAAHSKVKTTTVEFPYIEEECVPLQEGGAKMHSNCLLSAGIQYH